MVMDECQAVPQGAKAFGFSQLDTSFSPIIYVMYTGIFSYRLPSLVSLRSDVLHYKSKKIVKAYQNIPEVNVSGLSKSFLLPDVPKHLMDPL